MSMLNFYIVFVSIAYQILIDVEEEKNRQINPKKKKKKKTTRPDICLLIKSILCGTHHVIQTVVDNVCWHYIQEVGDTAKLMS